MFVVATDDFELYHDAVGELRDRGVQFTTVEPGEDLPEGTRAVLVGPDDEVTVPPSTVRVVVTPDRVRRAVEEALAALRAGGGRTVVGVDPGDRPGIAVLSGEMVVAAFHVPLAEAAETVRAEVADDVDPLVRIGDGARLDGNRILDELEDVPVELVDETGTTPYLGSGARGMGDVLAAVNIARLEGELVEERVVDPTAGELQRIKVRSRERSATNRAITEALARRVANGELTIEEALAVHDEAEAVPSGSGEAKRGADDDATDGEDAEHDADGGDGTDAADGADDEDSVDGGDGTDAADGADDEDGVDGGDETGEADERGED